MSIHNVSAYMNHGRWIADCPGPCANGAVEIPGRECDECKVLGCRTFVVPVPPLEADEIEMAVGLRPEARTRNWRGESVEKMYTETRDYLWPDREVDEVKAAAERALSADRPRYGDGRPAIHADFLLEDEKLGKPRPPIRYRGRRIYVPPNLPEGWSEDGISLPENPRSTKGTG